MSLKNFKSLFPLKIKLTKELINKGQEKLNHCGKCIGALALKKALGDNIKYLDNPNNVWGTTRGHFNIRVEKSLVGVTVCSYNYKGETIDMMDVTKPLTVTFKIKDISQI